MHTLNNLVLLTNNLYRNLASKISQLEPVVLLAARCYVAWAFFASGLTKLRDWDRAAAGGRRPGGGSPK